MGLDSFAAEERRAPDPRDGGRPGSEPPSIHPEVVGGRS